MLKKWWVSNENGFCDCYDRNPVHDVPLKLCCVRSYYIANVTLKFLDSDTSFWKHLKRLTYVENKAHFQNQSIYNLFIVVLLPPYFFFLLSTAASLSSQANYNQPLRLAAKSQLCPICLFNFFSCLIDLGSLLPQVFMMTTWKCHIFAMLWVHQKLLTYVQSRVAEVLNCQYS